jgi:hypothetical protein
MKTHHEPARDIPVVERADVLVAGAGPAGVAAAAGAAPTPPQPRDVPWAEIRKTLAELRKAEARPGKQPAGAARPDMEATA